MNFELLELLLKNDRVSATRSFRKSLDDSENLTQSLRSILVFAAHFTSGREDPDPLAVAQSLVNSFQRGGLDSGFPLEKWLTEFHEWIGNLERLDLDTSELKPDEVHSVVSVADLDASFATGNFDSAISSVASLLSIMDNKDYFFELLFRIALVRDSKAANAVSAFAQAVTFLGWKNHFAPFLIIHVIRLLVDLPVIDFSEKVVHHPVDIQNLDDLEFQAATKHIRQTTKLLSRDIVPLMVAAEKHHFSKRNTGTWPVQLSALEHVRAVAAVELLGNDAKSAGWFSKIPL